MLKSLRNHKTAGSAACRYDHRYWSQPTRRLNGGLLVRADAEKKKNQVSHDD